MIKIALLNIGTELLRGRTINTNASDIGKMLLERGFALDTTWVIHDIREQIVFALDTLLDSHDVLLITGGLGPTTDDITKVVLQGYFGGEMVCHEPTLNVIKQFLQRRNQPLLPHNERQSYVPSSCEVILNENGTAPCMVFRRDGKMVVSMPGVPFEMRHLMTGGVLPLLQKTYSQGHLASAVVRTFGIPESKIAEKMESITGGFDPRIDIAYLPSFDGTKIELKATGRISEQAEQEALVKGAQGQVAALLGDYVYALEDLSPVKLLARELLRHNIQISTAESCTGGAIAALLVEQSGISAVMKGSIVAYQVPVKAALLGVDETVVADQGVVSAAVAEAMAVGGLRQLGAEVCISITGIAEAASDAPTQEQPQAWIGLARAGTVKSTHIRLFRDRKVNIQFAVQAALVFALKELRG